MKNKSILALLIAGLVAAGAWAAPVEEEAAMVEEMSPIDMLAKIDHSAWGARQPWWPVRGDQHLRRQDLQPGRGQGDLNHGHHRSHVRGRRAAQPAHPGVGARPGPSAGRSPKTRRPSPSICAAAWSGRTATRSRRTRSCGASTRFYKNEEVETSIRDALNVGGELAEFELIDDLTYRVVLPSVYAGIFDIASIGRCRATSSSR